VLYLLFFVIFFVTEVFLHTLC